MNTLLVIALAATVHCSCPEPVSCKFLGLPGQRFTFEREAYQVPKEGMIEVLSERHNGCESSPQGVRVINRDTLKDAKFGTWVMQLPKGGK